MNLTNNQSETAHIGKPSLDLTDHQEAALAQLECWLPHITFDLHSRYLPTSVSENHLFAIGRLHPISDLPSNEPFPSTQDGWVLASVPSLSDKVIIGVFQESPQPFIDFIAGLDALSETADHIKHGFTDAIHHSVLNNRNQKSFVLAEFSELWPRLHIKKQRAAQASHAIRHYLQRDEVKFEGLLVIFTQTLSPQDSAYHLQAMSRLKHQLLELALPKRAQIDEDTLEGDAEEDNPTLSETISEDAFSLSSTAPINHNVEDEQEHQTDQISQQDQQLLRRYLTHRPKRLYFLFTVFLVASAIAFYLP